MGLIYKSHRVGIYGNLVELLLSFLDRKKQRVLLNGQCSSGFSLMLQFHNVRFPDVCFLISIFENLQSILTENLQSNLKLLAVFAMTNIPNGTVERLW